MLIVKQGIEGFISTNLNQPYNTWNSSTTYNADNFVIYENYVYKCIVDSNIGIIPSLNTGKWLLWKVDNSYAAIDLHSTTSSVIDDGLDYIEYIFNSNGYDILSFTGLYGDELTIYEYNASSILLNTRTINLPDETQSQSSDVFIDDLHQDTVKIKIRITKAEDNNAYVRTMVCGNSYDIGATRYGMGCGFIDYSLRETDLNGITSITKRNVRETMDATVMVDPSDSLRTKKFIKSCMGEVVLFIANPSTDSEFTSLSMLGYITDFSINFTSISKCFGNIKIEESL